MWSKEYRKFENKLMNIIIHISWSDGLLQYLSTWTFSFLRRNRVARNRVGLIFMDSEAQRLNLHSVASQNCLYAVLFCVEGQGLWLCVFTVYICAGVKGRGSSWSRRDMSDCDKANRKDKGKSAIGVRVSMDNWRRAQGLSGSTGVGSIQRSAPYIVYFDHGGTLLNCSSIPVLVRRTDVIVVYLWYTPQSHTHPPT